MSILDIKIRLPYNPKLSERAKEMRKNMTKPEQKIWFGYLRKLSQLPLNPPQGGGNSNDSENRGSKNSGSYKKIRVLRQRIIDNFIVDFYIPEFKTVIEIDGENHFTDDGKIYDEERTRVLESLGISVLRFTNEEVMSDFESVCEKIDKIFFK